MHVVSEMFCIGFGATALSALESNRERLTDMLEWASVPGRITDHARGRATTSTKGGYAYASAFRYTYSVGGVEYPGDTQDTGHSSSGPRWSSPRPRSATSGSGA